MNNETEDKIYTYQEMAEKCLTNYEAKFGTNTSTNYVIDEVNKETVKAVCQYFANDTDFEKIKEGFSLKKGLLIIGTAGTGKTHLMRNFQRNPKGDYKMIKCSEVSNQFSGYGRGELYKHSRCYDQNAYKLIGKCFDDLGVEDFGVNFSDKCDTMLNVLLDLYDNAILHYYLIHATSNLTPIQLEERYGTRLASRFKEMFNVLTLLGNDRRK
jgi:chromosomal replication initiation ATPase DnaA